MHSLHHGGLEAADFPIFLIYALSAWFDISLPVNAALRAHATWEQLDMVVDE